MTNHFIKYQSRFGDNEPIWQRRYFSFNLDSPERIREKIEYMHANPVRVELVVYPEEWEVSSTRYFIQWKSAGGAH